MKKLSVKLSISKDQTTGYKPVEVEFCRLHTFINSSYNYSSSFFKDGHRKNDNYLGGNNLIILDFDEGIPLERAIRAFKAWPNLITTTRNHQKEKNGKPACDRFRVVFPLAEPIDLPSEEFKRLMNYIINFYKSDAATCDPGRMYYGNPSGEHFYNFEGKLFDWKDWYTNIPKRPERKKSDYKIRIDENYKLEKLIAECPQIKNFTENQTNLNYGEWLHGCGVMAFLPEGNKLVHYYSSIDDYRYKEEETERNYQDAIGKLTGATRCETFYKLNKICDTCGYKHILNSPISLGNKNPSVIKDELELSPSELERRANNNQRLLDAYQFKIISFHNPVSINRTAAEQGIQVYKAIEEASQARYTKIEQEIEHLHPSYLEGEMPPIV